MCLSKPTIPTCAQATPTPTRIAWQRLNAASAIAAPAFSDEFSRGVGSRAWRVQNVALFRRRRLPVMQLF